MASLLAVIQAEEAEATGYIPADLGSLVCNTWTSFTVPTNAVGANFVIIGGGGGSGANKNGAAGVGGRGGQVSGNITLTAGQLLWIRVGCGGNGASAGTAGGYNLGGTSPSVDASGGGGSTAICIGSQTNCVSGQLVAIAGGGGGGGSGAGGSTCGNAGGAGGNAISGSATSVAGGTGIAGGNGANGEGSQPGTGGTGASNTGGGGTGGTASNRTTPGGVGSNFDATTPGQGGQASPGNSTGWVGSGGGGGGFGGGGGGGGGETNGCGLFGGRWNGGGGGGAGGSWFHSSVSGGAFAGIAGTAACGASTTVGTTPGRGGSATGNWGCPGNVTIQWLVKATGANFTTTPDVAAAGAVWPTQPAVNVSHFGTAVPSNPVTLSIKPGTGTPGAVLTCNATTVSTNASGNAAFGGCRINLAGTGYVLQASVDDIVGESAPFDVVEPLAAVDLWAPMTMTLSMLPGTQTSNANKIRAAAVIRHYPGTTVNGVRFDLVHPTSGGTYGGVSCATTATITCSGGYVGTGGWNNFNNRATAVSLTVRELPTGLVSSGAQTDATRSNYSFVTVEITPPNFTSWQNDGPDGQNVCGLEGGGATGGDQTSTAWRACLNDASFSFRLSDNSTTQDMVMPYWSIAEENGSGPEDYPAVFNTGATTNNVVVPASTPGAITIAYTCDDNDGAGSGQQCDSARLRYRRMGNNTRVNLVCSSACETRNAGTPNVNGNFNADNNVARSYSASSPSSSGLWVIEAQFCNENGDCPFNAPPGYGQTETWTYVDHTGTTRSVVGGSDWQHLGFFYVNAEAPTVSAVTPASNIAGLATRADGTLRPPTDATLTWTATTSNDVQVLDWDLDGQPAGGIGGSAYEQRTYGTVAYGGTNGAGTVTLNKTATVSLVGRGGGEDCSVAVRAYDRSAVNAADVAALSTTAASAPCVTNHVPEASSTTSMQAPRGRTTTFTIDVDDLDGWVANGTGDEEPVLTLTSQPAVGAVSCGAFEPQNASWGRLPCSYVVPANVPTGPFSFTYRVRDSHNGFSQPATISGNITNTAPVASNDSTSVQRGSTFTVNLPATDFNNDTLTFTKLTNPGFGAGTCTTAGACTFTVPPNTTVGNYAFSFKANDGLVDSNTASYLIAVANTAPVANDLTVPIQRGGAPVDFELDVVDLNGDTLTYTVLTQPARGTLSCTGASCTYSIPADAASGNVTFTYRANDGVGNSNTATVTLAVGNTKPVVTNLGPITVLKGETAEVTLEGTDPNGDTLTFTAPVTAPTKGVVGGSAANRTYQPNPGAGGLDSFTYTASDNEATSDPATVSFIIPNTAPEAEGQELEVQRGVATPIQLTGSDADLDPLTFALQSNVSKGWLECQANGACVYTATPGETGTDSFTFVSNDTTANSEVATVTITIANTAPELEDLDLGDVQRGRPAAENPFVLSATDLNGDPITYSVLGQPAVGTVSCETSGICTYSAPANSATGTYTFGVRADDGNARADATVTVTVLNTAPVAQNDTVSAPRGLDTHIVLGASDLNNDTIAYTVVSQPTKGVLDCNGQFGEDCLYSVPPGASGSDWFTFRVSDGDETSELATVTITITNQSPTVSTIEVQAPRGLTTPVQLLGFDPNSDSLTFEVASQPEKGIVNCDGSGSCTYSAGVGVTGTDSFTYVATDGDLSSVPATVEITLTNQAPVGNAQTLTVGAESTTPLVLSASDINSDTLTYSILNQPGRGSVQCDGDGSTCSYTADPGPTGTDSFTFVANDGLDDSDPVTVTVNIQNVIPEAADLDIEAPRGISTPVQLSGTDEFGRDLTYEVLTQPAKGTLSCDEEDGSLCTYTAGIGQTGEDTFTFRTDNGIRPSTTATVTITITNQGPIPLVQTIAAEAPLQVTRFFLAAADPNGDDLTFELMSQPAKGTLSCGTDGACEFTANPGSSGIDTFTFRGVDEFGLAGETGTLTLDLDDSTPGAFVGKATKLEPESGNSPARGTVLPITLTNPSPVPLTVWYYTTDESATRSADYTPFGTPDKPRSVSIPAGATWTVIAPPVRDDDLVEGDETFKVHVVSVTGGPSYLLPSVTRVTILDADSRPRANPATPLLSITDVTQFEGNAPTPTRRKAQVRVELSKPLTTSFSVRATTVDGTAKAGTDYIGKTQVITFAPGEVEKSFDVSILANGTPDPFLRAFNIQLSDLTGPEVVVAKGTSVFEILDED